MEPIKSTWQSNRKKFRIFNINQSINNLKNKFNEFNLIHFSEWKRAQYAIKAFDKSNLSWIPFLRYHSEKTVDSLFYADWGDEWKGEKELNNNAKKQKWH